MTAEDKALVEALVDGELGELQRRELLVRLDRIDGGWKFCAVSFLESQCFRETFDAFGGDWESFFAEPSRSTIDTFSTARAETGKKNGKDVDLLDRTRFSNETPIPNAFQNSKSVRNLIDSIRNEENWSESATNDALFSGNAALRPADFAQSSDFNASFCNNADSFRREEVEPRIIPLKRGGYRNDFRKSSRRGGSGGGDGPTWRARFASTAGGFLLAFALGGVFYSQFVASSGTERRVDGPVSTLTNASSQTPQNLRLAQNSYSPQGAPNASGAEISVDLADFNDDSASPLRVVTLKSPQRRLDDVAVPCFVADDSNAAAFRDAKFDVPPQIVEQVRKTGGRIVAKRDEYRFKIDDKRILIIPVDAYDIQYENYQNAR